MSELKEKVVKRVNIYIDSSIDKQLDEWQHAQGVTEDCITAYDKSHDFKFIENMKALFDDIDRRWDVVRTAAPSQDPLSSKIVENLHFMFFMHVFGGAKDDEDSSWLTTIIEDICRKITVSMMLCVFA